MKRCKVYKDGSHFIAIVPTKGNSGVRRKPPPEEPILVEETDETAALVEEGAACPIGKGPEKETEEGRAQGGEPALKTEENSRSPEVKGEEHKKSRVSTRSEEFLKWYRESVGMNEQAQFRFIASKMESYFASKKQLYRFLEQKMFCRKRAEITRRIRCVRRASLHELSYFATFTFDGRKLTEKEFEKKLLTTLRHLASRKGWKYMGTWERGGEHGRLHFHAIMYIPEGKTVGKFERKREYNVKTRRMEERIENTFFCDRFGRNEFAVIDGTALTIGTAVGYIIKYIEKTGGRIICSRGMRTFIETDIDEKDIIGRLRKDDAKKYLLFDDFKVYKDEEELGTVSPGVLARAKTVN